MSELWMTLGVVFAFGGGVLVVQSLRRPQVDAAAVLAELEASPADEPLDEFEGRLQESFAPRLLRPAGRKMAGLMQGLLPGNYLDRLRHKLVVAGFAGRVAPEEFLTLQLVSSVVGGLLGWGLAVVRGWGPVGLGRAIVVMAALGFLAPVNWLQRGRERRQLAVRRDLPDILDLMAISVEAGVGLEGAIEVVTQNFDGPLAREMGRMLREMELGVSRRGALTNLKRRLEVPEVGNFVLSLVQADALGMPLGRVLHAQANELRLRRRQWARERAARLPVKIVFPLMVFILPALFVVVLGPAVISISENIL